MLLRGSDEYIFFVFIMCVCNVGSTDPERQRPKHLYKHSPPPELRGSRHSQRPVVELITRGVREAK